MGAKVSNEFKDLIKCQYHELMPITELLKKKNPRNRNHHPEAQIKRLAKIMRDNGIRHPIVISNQSSYMTKGHGRLEAALFNQWDSYPVQFQDYRNEDLEYADMTADNAIASWAELDFSEINKDLEHLGPFDIELLGIKDFELEPADKYADKDADHVPEVKNVNVTRGDLFQLGAHRLYCGDATNASDVERLMNGEKADAVVTDPPYGIGFNYNSHDDNESDWYDLINKVMPILKSIAPFIVMPCCRIKSLKWWYENHSPEWIICWYKGSPGHLSSIGFNDWEPHLTWGRPKTPMHDYFQTECGFEENGHPCPKPVAYALWLVERAVDSCGIIFEPFCGSGTTLIACEKTNRRCFGMEIDPQYCQVIIDRWEKFTGQKAVKL